jgi:hypothetical protein
MNGRRRSRRPARRSSSATSRQPGNAWLMVGIALMELEQLQESRRAFQQAQEFDVDSRRQAREWQRFVEDRIQVAELRSRS